MYTLHLSALYKGRCEDQGIVTGFSPLDKPCRRLIWVHGTGYYESLIVTSF